MKLSRGLARFNKRVTKRIQGLILELGEQLPGFGPRRRGVSEI